MALRLIERVLSLFAVNLICVNAVTLWAAILATFVGTILLLRPR
jgi:hypothetical protein